MVLFLAACEAVDTEMGLRGHVKLLPLQVAGLLVLDVVNQLLAPHVHQSSLNSSGDGLVNRVISVRGHRFQSVRAGLA